MTGREVGRDSALDAYLVELDAALASLPDEDRREILLETRSHVLERTRRAPTCDANAVLAELGAAAAYGRQFLATEPPSPIPAGSVALRALAQLAAGGWPTLPLLLLVIVGYGIAGLALIFVFAELVDPAGTGLMIGSLGNGRTYIHFIMSGTPEPEADVLGPWFAPLLLLVAGAVYLAIRRLLKRVLRRPASRP